MKLAYPTLFALAATYLTGCATSYSYKLYPGSALQESELAVLAVSYAAPISIDGFNVSPLEYQLVELKPGSYRIDHGFFYSIVSRQDEANVIK